MIGESRIVVRYAETDKMGVVYHANYLIWFEVARTEFLETLGIPYLSFEKQGLMSPVVHAECDYGEPLRYGDVAIVRIKLIEMSKVKAVYSYEVYREGQVFDKEKPSCSGKTVHCIVDAKTFKPLNMKKEAPDLFEIYQRVLERP